MYSQGNMALQNVISGVLMKSDSVMKDFSLNSIRFFVEDFLQTFLNVKLQQSKENTQFSKLFKLRSIFSFSVYVMGLMFCEIE